MARELTTIADTTDSAETGSDFSAIASGVICVLLAGACLAIPVYGWTPLLVSGGAVLLLSAGYVIGKVPDATPSRDAAAAVSNSSPVRQSN